MRVRISSTSHRVTVIAKKRRADIAVDGRAKVVAGDWGTTVSDVRSPLTIRVPEGTDVVVGTSSGRVQLKGTLADVAVTSNSGRVEVESAESVDIRTDSGRVTVGTVAADCRVSTKSARVEVAACGDAELSTDSGRIQLQGGSGTTRAHCVSGRIELGLTEACDVDAETVSGRIKVELPEGVRAYLPEVGEVAGPPPAGYDCVVAARSVSGRVNVSSQ